MPDTRREKSALQTLHADNTAGDISAQDNRDGWETCHPAAAVQTAAFASEPASGQVTGDLFLPNNSYYIERYSGSAWVAWGPNYPFTKPVSGDFAWINQGSAALNTTPGGIHLSCTGNGGSHNTKLRKKTAPATPYSITAAVLANSSYGGSSYYAEAGLCWRQSSDGKLVCVHYQWGTVSSKIQVTKWSAATSQAAVYVDQAMYFPQATSVGWIRLTDNGTNRIVELSADGQNWIVLHTVGRTDYMTADEVGFSVNPYSVETGITLLSWKES